MRKRKCERRNQLFGVLEKLKKISSEIHDSSENCWSSTVLGESDLSSRKLDDLHRELQAIQKEKISRKRLMMSTSLGDNSEETKNIRTDSIESLTNVIKTLVELKLQRMQRLQDLATSMLELWNLMDTPIEEQQMFHHVTFKVAASEEDIFEPGMLSAEFINEVQLEVSRLDELKSSKMKELVLKKRTELEEI